MVWIVESTWPLSPNAEYLALRIARWYPSGAPWISFRCAIRIFSNTNT